MINNEEANVNKTLTDIIDPDKLTLNAILHWGRMDNSKKKQKGCVYNKILQKQWNIDTNFEWDCEYHNLAEVQKRMLLKKELINAYDNLEKTDKMLFNQYLDINTENTKWYTLNKDDKKKIIRALFNIF